MILIWVSTDTNLVHQIITHKYLTRCGDSTISSVVTIAIEQKLLLHLVLLVFCLLGLFRVVTYFSTFKLWFTLRISASAEASESPISRL